VLQFWLIDGGDASPSAPPRTAADGLSGGGVCYGGGVGYWDACYQSADTEADRARLRENIPGIDGTRRGLAQAGDFARFVEGLAIYAYWATDDTEWQQFKSEWVDRS
jgi:hypothetical protein